VTKLALVVDRVGLIAVAVGALFNGDALTIVDSTLSNNDNILVIGVDVFNRRAPAQREHNNRK
jgi:hypothetical protein